MRARKSEDSHTGPTTSQTTLPPARGGATGSMAWCAPYSAGRTEIVHGGVHHHELAPPVLLAVEHAGDEHAGVADQHAPRLEQHLAVEAAQRALHRRAVERREWRLLVPVLDAEPAAHVEALELLVKIAEVGLCALPQLHGDDVAERVRRGKYPIVMSDQWTSCDTADHDVGRLEPEVLAHLRVERLGEILEREVAGEHRALELEAEDDVQAVRHLVSVDAAVRRLHLVQRTMERLERDVAERCRERVLQLG